MIPITVFTGFLGAGKTSIILSLLPRLPTDYKVVLLKNEFGNVEVDSQLAANSSLAAVSEILNGCMCCVLVGQMKSALLEIRDQHRPDRIIVESSGSAFPATLAFQIRELERETGDFTLDAIVTVVDAENFAGYEDTSPTAKMQAQYTDVILINKWEHVSERNLDIVLDHLGTLNDLTPKIRVDKSGVPPNLIFGLDSKQFLHVPEHGTVQGNHHAEVETVTLATDPHSHTSLGPRVLTDALGQMPKDAVYRVKGFVGVPEGIQVLNWAFGRMQLVPLGVNPRNPLVERLRPGDVLLTVMGAAGEVAPYAHKLAEALGADVL